MSQFTVLSTSTKDHEKKIFVSGGEDKRATIKVHRYAVVGKEDKIYVDPKHPSKVFIVPNDSTETKIPLSPHWEALDRYKIGNVEFQIKLKEISTKEDLINYNYLEKFHYKTSSVLSDDLEQCEDQPTQGSGCRKAVLLCYMKQGNRWTAIGYMELHMPLLMVKPRHVLFANSYDNSDKKIKWDKWDQHEIKKHVNCIVRIARVVISPEYRGLGITKIIIKHTKEFSRERWHIRGVRPIFIEILAEMLKYVDFVSNSGFCYAGNTEGNLSRVHKDLTYMQRDYDTSSGIMTLQKKYLSTLKKGAESLGRSFDDVMNQLKEIASNPEILQKLTPGEWYTYKSVLRLPIPYFICGLDDYSSSYIEKNTKNIENKYNPAKQFEVKPAIIRINGLKITSVYRLPQTKTVRSIMECFGLEGEILNNNILGPIDIEASGGNIFFITGASGSGKSVLLKAIDTSFESTYLEIKRNIADVYRYSCGWMNDIESDDPIIEYFSNKYGVEKSISALNQAGLSEAFVYLKPYSLLSRGQRYRARLAELALGSSQVWLIDEFGADLDPLTARIVANNLKKHVIKYKRIAFVAAANHQHYLDALRPSKILVLRQGGGLESLSYKDYCDEFYTESWR